MTHHFVDLPGLRMHYVEAGGEPGAPAKPVVVLLHGFPETWWSWRYQLIPFSEAGFRVIAPDLRGYGETDKTGPYDLDTVVGDVCALIDSLGLEDKRVCIVGHDWGGATAWHLAARRPEYCGRLAVLNCPHPGMMREALLTRPKWAQLRRSWYIFLFQLPLLPEWLLARHGGANVVRAIRGSSVDRTHLTGEEVRPFREAVLRPGAARAMVGWYRAALRPGVAQTARYQRITVEALLIWAKEDPALGYDELVPGTERFAARLRVEPIEGCGHFVQSERPDRVNALLLDFLAARAAEAKAS